MIGIYGGTFNPIHFGHLRTALEIKEIFSLHEVRLIPCAQPAHREIPLTSPQMRLKMLELAVQGHQGLVVDKRELDRTGFSYMIDTLISLRNEHTTPPLLLIIGTDAFKGLENWHQWQHLFNYAHIIVITRPTYQQQELSDFLTTKLTKNKDKLKSEISGYLFFQSVTQLDISASMIRDTIKEGLNPAFLLPNPVIEYIKTNQLYKK
jgi:nicotinate-nucleotide adenylyltransferase